MRTWTRPNRRLSCLCGQPGQHDPWVKPTARRTAREAEETEETGAESASTRRPASPGCPSPSLNLGFYASKDAAWDPGPAGLESSSPDAGYTVYNTMKRARAIHPSTEP